jgi:sodium/hydrogen antiporter
LALALRNWKFGGRLASEYDAAGAMAYERARADYSRQEIMAAQALTPTLALVGLVIVAAALLSGLVERRGLPQVVVFLGIGALLGAPGLGLVFFGLESTSLHVIATLGLTLVLFVDAVSVSIRELRERRRIALVVLGPGTLVPAGIIAAVAVMMLGVSWPGAIVLGAALASTDPVMVRGLLRRPGISPDTRTALRMESGMNDVALLPVLLVAMLFMRDQPPTMNVFLAQGLGLFVLGPAAGVGVGVAGIKILDFVRKRAGVRRDYESMYAIGLAFAAYAAAEAFHGSGFLAAFGAGLTIAALDVELCDCFVDFGEASAEMFLLLTFVAFGAGPIWHGLQVLDWKLLAFGAIALVARTIVLLPVLRLTAMDPASRRLVSWFGPRGLNTMLLALLPVFAGIAGSERLFAICAAVVLMSVVVHGTALAVISWRTTPAASSPRTLEQLESLDTDGGASSERISLEELETLRQAGREVIVVDVRKDSTYAAEGTRAKDSVRMPPDDAVAAAEALKIPRGAILALYCT